MAGWVIIIFYIDIRNIFRSPFDVTDSDAKFLCGVQYRYDNNPENSNNLNVIYLDDYLDWYLQNIGTS